MLEYKVLKQQIYQSDNYLIMPIRMEDRYNIMQWRNDQIYHLRQNKELTEADQDRYFSEVVAKLFDQEQPGQILFSYMQGTQCIGYGGLVHINWTDRNAEISFIMKTELQTESFEFHWSTFLNLVEQVAFNDLGFHKIFTYAFNLRERLYPALENVGFKKEAVLKEHIFYKEQFVDVVIHAKYNRQLILRKATTKDLEITFKWARDPNVRQYAINQTEIQFPEHSKWFKQKLLNTNCVYTMAEYNSETIGSFRLDIDEKKQATISYLLDPKYHGLGLGVLLLEAGIGLAKETDGVKFVIGDVKADNNASVRIFKKLGFTEHYEENDLLRFQLDIS